MFNTQDKSKKSLAKQLWK